MYEALYIFDMVNMPNCEILISWLIHSWLIHSWLIHSWLYSWLYIHDLMV